MDGKPHVWHTAGLYQDVTFCTDCFVQYGTPAADEPCDDAASECDKFW